MIELTVSEFLIMTFFAWLGCSWVTWKVFFVIGQLLARAYFYIRGERQ